MLAAEILRHRSLVWALARRDLLARYRGTFFGFAWTFLHQLIYLATYSFVFGSVARLGVERYPAFVLTGLLPWTWFSSCLLIGATSILGDAALVKRAAFPASVPPVVVSVSTLVNFLLGLPILFLVLAWFGIAPTVWVLTLPLVIGLQFVISLGGALALAALTVRFRDVGQLAQVLMPVWFLLSPIAYPPELLAAHTPSWLETVALWANPVAVLARTYQRVLFLREAPEPQALALLAAFAVLAFLAGERVLDALRDRIPEEV
jgi:lipopolysaccharide transport system permease protein